MPGARPEAETAVRRILPYLRRRGYQLESDMDFEASARDSRRRADGFVGLLVARGRQRPRFVIAVKRNGRNLTSADADQAVSCARPAGAGFAVITNGRVLRVLNAATGQPLRWGGRPADSVPAERDLADVLAFLRAHPTAAQVPLDARSAGLPFRPALPRKQLGDLFSRCHNKIRNIEKDDEHAFADLSKILFLRLLEEKADQSGFALPYPHAFWQLAEHPAAHAAQVKDAVLDMLAAVETDERYRGVLSGELRLKHPATFRFLVRELSAVSLADSDYDVKGSAFEYFVTATLKGRKLGQYFTPRPVIKLMAELVGREAIVGALRSGAQVRVADPACGTGGFLGYLLGEALSQLDELLAERRITAADRAELAGRLTLEVFHGADANEGVASAAKMHMVVAGGGHDNIRCENSLLPGASLWPSNGPARYDFILTNPPFGTAEGDSLSPGDMTSYPVPGGRGQHLFLQRMVLATKPMGYICTVIDEGLLNTDTAGSLREWVMRHARLVAVVQLPEETFKPNKINVRSSVLLMRRRAEADADLQDGHPVVFGAVESLGYHGSGQEMRGFDVAGMLASLRSGLLDHGVGSPRHGVGWGAFDVPSADIAADPTNRWDRKYWEPRVRARSAELRAAGGATLGSLNLLPTSRGSSPSSSLYVDEPDGHAVVVKAGSCITKHGSITLDGADWIEKSTFDDMPARARLQPGDVLLASTGVGTLGKAAVYDLPHEAVADAHVTVIRTDPAVIDPYYLADYLRCGFGQDQMQRLYTGSTGLIELTAEHVDSIVVAMLGGAAEQRRLSARLRASEDAYVADIGSAEAALAAARAAFGAAAQDRAAARPLPC